MAENIILSSFGKYVFGDAVMQQRLPRETYLALKDCIKNNQPLSLEIANVVANEMKDWALELGATHFTHWFQPLTGVTAEKHDSFLESENGKPIVKFSGKMLIKGETDGSSFPSGGLRATFEARGYTAWDPTSYAFVRGTTLYIPTAFCSYGGEALDQKTPLLRSIEVVEKEAAKILSLFGKEEKVTVSVGAEQEYFLVDDKVHDSRLDLVVCGTTLFGAKPPKGQELDDHYFGKINDRVLAYMADLDRELWELGVYAKTKHNEAAPAQHELAPLYGANNLATDHNQLTMAMMKRIAHRHGMVCLLHEKPFNGISGSGKHNNWSLQTASENLFKPGKAPAENLQFLLFLVAVLKAVDEYQDLLRISVASASNDHRLGANDAPPAIMSVFLGDELSSILESMERGERYSEKTARELLTGVSVITHFNQDKTDRNRTSPFAFTGNKFEFRMPGSQQSIASPNLVLNTAVAKVLADFYAELSVKKDLTSAVRALICETYRKHKRIVYNGNNYSAEWKEEAHRRGLSDNATTVDAVKRYLDDKNVALFSEFGVLSPAEMHSRYEIMLSSYAKQIVIEGETMLTMLRKNVLSGVMRYKGDLAKWAGNIVALSDADVQTEKELLVSLGKLTAQMLVGERELKDAIQSVKSAETALGRAEACKLKVIPAMNRLRNAVDGAELITGKEYWTMPDYNDLLYSVR